MAGSGAGSDPAGVGKANAYAEQVRARLQAAGLRAEANLKGDRIGYKIRQAACRRSPTYWWWARRKQRRGAVNVRSRDEGELGENGPRCLLGHRGRADEPYRGGLRPR